jgi:polyribonucleotide nucleotidyltransferase
MEKIQWNGEEFLVQLDPLMMKANCTVKISQGENNLWVSVLLTPLENKYYSFKQLSINYHSAIFTRVLEKKNTGKDVDYDTLIARNMDRSLRSHIPDQFAYSINIDCWNPDSTGKTTDNIEEVSNKYFAMGLIGANIALLSFNILDHAIMPIHILGDKSQITGAIYNDKISNLEISSSAITIDIIEKELAKFFIQYANYNEHLKKSFHNTIKIVAQQADDSAYLHRTTNILERIDGFYRKKILSETIMDNLLKRILKQLTLQQRELFIHGQFDKSLEVIIYHYLNQEEKDYLNKSLFYEGIFYAIKEHLLCEAILKTKKREDKRKLQQERNIQVENYPLSNFHSGIFLNKGKTRVLVGSYFFDGEKNMDITSQNKNGIGSPRVNVKYIFNQFINHKRSTTSRREIGHCNLIQKSINNNVFPQNNGVKAFCNCYVTNSDGSSSMLSVIGCGLLLHRFGFSAMDPIAGVSIGLIEDYSSGKEKENFLVDITENEDFYCSMDMKIVATHNGIVAAQLDVKNTGITLSTLKKALQLAVKTIDRIIKTLYSPSNMERIVAPYSLNLPIPQEEAMNNINNYKLFLQKQYSVVILMNLEKKSISVVSYDIFQLFEAQERIIKDNWLTPRLDIEYFGKVENREDQWYVYCFCNFYPLILTKKQHSTLVSGNIYSIVLKDNNSPISFAIL